MTYVVYRVGKIEGQKESVTRIMSNDDVETLRSEANHFFALPENLVGRKDEQLIIPVGQLHSNTVTTVAGDKPYHRYIEIRQINKV